MKKITIEVNERQARIILAAVEEWFRLRIGQGHDLADDLAFYGYDREKHPNGFYDRLEKRNCIETVLKAVFQIAFPVYGVPQKSDPEVTLASDIWSELRYHLTPKDEWNRLPFQMGEEPMPKITVEDAADE